MPSFRERIYELWENAKDDDYKITQEDFAEKFGATRNQLKGWIAGTGEPSSEMFKKIAATFDVSVDWLVGNSDIRAPITTIAAHRTDDPRADLPEEAQKSVDEFIELMKIKHGINKK